MGEVSNTRSEPRPNIVCLEGNGSRPSHRGIGFLESEVMYTLNSTEIHSVCYSIDMGGGKSSCVITENLSPTLACTHYGEPAVVYQRNNEDETHKLGISSE